ncbi:hypothetical protein ACHWQZ_G015988 [Mnemiopsis leidyi]
MGLLKKLKETSSSNRKVIIALTVLLVVLLIVVIAVVATNVGKSGDGVKSYGAPWEDPRLGKEVLPVHYNITVNIDVTHEKFWGHETIELDIKAPNISSIVLHAEKIDIPADSKVLKLYYKVAGEDKQHDIEIKRHRAHKENHYYVIELRKYLIPETGRIYFLDIDWSGVLKYQLSGLYLSQYEEEGETRKSVSSQFQPVSAREAFPCFDEPEYKATFEMTIVAEQNYSFVSWNTEQLGKEEMFNDENGRGWKKVKFAKTPTMSTYVMAFVVANFDCINKTITSVDNKEILTRVCARPSLIKKHYGEYSLEKGGEILKYFENYFNQPYPLKKCDHVGIAEFGAGAMENWGLILYREELLLFNDTHDPTKSKGKVNLVVSHELAHMWFGNLVTMKWWNDIWLNEGFATYVQSLGTEASDDDWTNDPFLISEWRLSSMTQDSYISSRPASVIVTDPSSVHHLFDSIAYNKGASLLRQLSMVMDNSVGDNEKTESFQDGVKNYLAKYKFGNANQSQLYWSLGDSFQSKTENGPTIEQIMKTWTLQMNFPVVTVDKYDENRLILSQRRFLIADESQGEGFHPSPYGYQWYVPIKYKTKSGTDATSISDLMWIQPNGHLITPLDGQDAIFLNWEGNGFYVTSYSVDLWDALIAALTHDTEDNQLDLSSREKQVLLYDTFLLVNAGYYPISRQIQLLKLDLFSQSDDYNVLKEAFRQIGTISSLVKTNEDVSTTWRANWVESTKNVYDAAKDLDENYENQLMKSMTMSLCLEYNDNTDHANIQCVQKAKELWEGRETKRIAADYKSAVYSYAAKLSAGEWDNVWAKYDDPQATAAEKNLLSISLAQTDDLETVKKYIGYCMDSTKVRKSNGLAIMGRYIAKANSVSSNYSLHYMLDNWPKIYENFKTLDLECPNYIKSVISQITNQDDLDRVIEKFKDPEYMIDAIKVDYDAAINTARANIKWLKENGAAINS